MRNKQKRLKNMKEKIFDSVRLYARYSIRQD